MRAPFFRSPASFGFSPPPDRRASRTARGRLRSYGARRPNVDRRRASRPRSRADRPFSRTPFPHFSLPSDLGAAPRPPLAADGSVSFRASTRVCLFFFFFSCDRRLRSRAAGVASPPRLPRFPSRPRVRPALFSLSFGLFARCRFVKTPSYTVRPVARTRVCVRGGGGGRDVAGSVGGSKGDHSVRMASRSSSRNRYSLRGEERARGDA